MLRLSILGALLSATLAAAGGCDLSETSDVETVRSGVTGAGGGATAGTVDSALRGFTSVTTDSNTGYDNETHVVVYRGAPNGFVGRHAGTPLGPLFSLGGTVAPGSAPWGYRRADGVDAILYIDANRHVHEITLSGDFDYNPYPISAPLAAAAPANGPVPDVIGYRRSDGRSAVVYRDENNHVIEILSNPGRGYPWVVYDLTDASGAQVTANKGTVFPYVRSDSYNTLVYVASDNHIHELYNYFGETSWGDGDLSAATGDTLPPATDPWGYSRSDGYNCVVFVSSDGQMHELAYYPGFWWGAWYLPAASPQTGPFMRPSAYVRQDGTNVVVYLGSDAHVHELALLSNGWTDGILPTGNSVLPTSQLFGHQTALGRSSVLFRGTSLGVVHGYELSLPFGGSWALQEL